MVQCGKKRDVLTAPSAGKLWELGHVSVVTAGGDPDIRQPHPMLYRSWRSGVGLCSR